MHRAGEAAERDRVGGVQARQLETEEIGEYLSALANSAALAGKASAYLLWGIDDAEREIVGTSFEPAITRKGGEELESWLLRLLEPKIAFRFTRVLVRSVHVVILEVERAWRQPVRFAGVEYIRIGSYKKKLKDFPERERALWRYFDATPFESRLAAQHQTGDEIEDLLNVMAYFELLSRSVPPRQDDRLGYLEADRLIVRDDAGDWSVTNLGALLLATDLRRFGSLERKAPRVVAYVGNDRREARPEKQFSAGYAASFTAIVDYLEERLARTETIEKSLRRSVSMLPLLAVRELVANALIHQDLTVSGSGPLIELFENRLELSNPGHPLVEPDRFVDMPPRSRNDALAALMRRFGVCEERGSGIDKVVFEMEFGQMPAPLFESPGGATRSILFARRPLGDMDKDDRVRACYLHACLRHVNREPTTNASLRGRFGIEKKNASIVSRLLNEAIDAGYLVIEDEAVGTKSRRYLPYWALEPGERLATA